MAFRETFKATSEGVELNQDIFAEGKKLEDSLSSKVNEAKKRLAEMSDAIKEEVGSNELKAASEAVSQELNDSIPPQFRAEYEAAANGAEAAELIQKHILEKANNFIAQKMEGIV
ncbi:hypothetical protein JXD20_00635 [Candidatus Peregrinibacteria bacterium]|nr:hypothetical protein [Candidatus Peregrinibacteria bacterium]